MTESQWDRCSDPQTMADLLRSDRKKRLFACALGRRLWSRLTNDAVRHAVEFAEQVADDRADAAALDSVWHEALQALPKDRGRHAHWAASHSASSDIQFWAGASACQAGMTGLRKAGVVAVLREISGNPFRPTAIDPTWLTSTVRLLATAGYDERSLPSGELDTVRLAILADALEEAGCTDDAILSHLRSPGPHVRGCWALDNILGKE